MGVARWSVSLVAIIGLLAVTVAGATIWLLLTDPVKVANGVSALSTGDASPVIQAIGDVFLRALQGLFKYL